MKPTTATGLRSITIRPLFAFRSNPLKTLVESLVVQALAALPAGILPEDAQASARLAPADIERTRDARYGDFA